MVGTVNIVSSHRGRRLLTLGSKSTMNEKSGLSEFSYGYSVIEAFAKRWQPKLTAAPILPSLKEEGAIGGGYDALLQRPGILMYLQFKKSQFIQTGNAKEVRQNRMLVPLYRMYLLRRNKISSQHQQLIKLETSPGQRVVRYVAPLFHTVFQLNQFYLSDQILQKSIFLRPSRFDVKEDDPSIHHASFRSRTEVDFFSDPQRFEVAGDEGTLEREVVAQIEETHPRSLASGLQGELSRVLDVIAEPTLPLSLRRDVDRLRDTDMPLQHIAYASRTFLSAEALIVVQNQTF
jgi:hypothetical protein